MDLTYYNKQVLANPTATAEAKERAQKELGISSAINAGEIKDSTAIDVGMFPKGDTSAITDAKLSTNGILESLQAQQTVSLQKEKEAKQLQTELGTKPTTDIAGTQATAETQYGVSALTEKQTTQAVKVASIKSELDKLELQEQTEIDRTRQQMANVPTYIVDRQVNQISRDYASQKAYVAVELSAQAAILSVYQGDLQGAQQQVQNAVQNYIYDLTQKREDFDNLFNYYGDWIKDLDKEQQDILTEARGEVARQEDNARKDAEFKYQQVIDKAQMDLAWYKAQEAPSAPSSYQEWSLAGGQEGTGKSYSEWLSTGEDKLLSVAEAEKLGVPYGTTQEEVISNIENTTEITKFKTAGKNKTRGRTDNKGFSWNN